MTKPDEIARWEINMRQIIIIANGINSQTQLQVWSHGGSTFKKKRTLNGRFSRPAETDPYVGIILPIGPIPISLFVFELEAEE